MRDKIYNYYSEFQLSLKAPDVEERLDIYFFRPLAFAILKLFKVFSLSPTHYSILALLSGLLSGYFYSQGTHSSFIIGAYLFLLFGILDCCDGMLARMENKASQFGRILDGIVDFLANAFVYIGLNIGLKKAGFPSPISDFSLVLFAGVGKWFQNNFYDNYLWQYVAFKNGTGHTEEEIVSIKSKLNDTDSFFKKIHLYLYLGFTKIQNSLVKASPNIDPKKYCEQNRIPMLLWGLLGSSAHIFALVIASFMFYPEFFFFYALIFSNLWMLFMFFYQLKINKQLVSKT